MSLDTAVREDWYITTDFFSNGGKYLQGLGPWPTKEEALACRAGYEIGSGQVGLFYVDKA